MNEFFFQFFTKQYFCDQVTGIVVSGFGEEQIYPAVYTCCVSHLVINKLLRISEEEARIDNNITANIWPFAQVKDAQMVVRGIHPDIKLLYQNSVNSMIKQSFEKIRDAVSIPEVGAAISNLLDNSILDAISDGINKKLDDEVWRIYVSPLVNSVSFLEKEDLADFAESLVKITSLKRKISPNQPTVGGPIDVMVISKGDGIVWMKRKLYFDSDINPLFNHNYFKN